MARWLIILLIVLGVVLFLIATGTVTVVFMGNGKNDKGKKK